MACVLPSTAPVSLRRRAQRWSLRRCEESLERGHPISKRRSLRRCEESLERGHPISKRLLRFRHGAHVLRNKGVLRKPLGVRALGDVPGEAQGHKVAKLWGEGRVKARLWLLGQRVEENWEGRDVRKRIGTSG